MQAQSIGSSIALHYSTGVNVRQSGPSTLRNHVFRGSMSRKSIHARLIQRTCRNGVSALRHRYPCLQSLRPELRISGPSQTICPKEHGDMSRPRNWSSSSFGMHGAVLFSNVLFLYQFGSTLQNPLATRSQCTFYSEFQTHYLEHSTCA
jgi:hypothetical protein